MKDYSNFYRVISQPFQTRSHILIWLNHLVTAFVYLTYPSVLMVLGRQQEWDSLGKLFFYPLVGFCLVSLYRKLVNQARPYETWEIDPILQKETRGQSFPSRHVFSATVIGTVLLTVHTLLGSFILFLAVLLAFLRVIGGVHYPKDVIVGFLLGLLFGLPVLL